MAVAVTFGHSWASAVFCAPAHPACRYPPTDHSAVALCCADNFSVIKLEKDESLPWDDMDYKKAWAEREKRVAVLSFDVHGDVCTVLRKGKVERTQAMADIVSFREDESCATALTLQFALPDDPKKRKKFVEFESFQCWNRFDRQIIQELIVHAQENDGSIQDLEDRYGYRSSWGLGCTLAYDASDTFYRFALAARRSFPKQTLHHGVLQIKQKTSFDAKYCVLVKWKLFVYASGKSRCRQKNKCAGDPCFG